MGYIYLIREREFVNTKEKIYKVGRTDSYDVRSRLKSYPADSEVIFFINVDNSKEIEKRLLKEFDKYFENLPKIGREYYRGNKDQMVHVIISDKELKDLKTMEVKPLSSGWKFSSILKYLPGWN